MVEKEQHIDAIDIKGSRVTITLEEWTKSVVKSAIISHGLECQFIKEEHPTRLTKLETKMSFVQWIGGAVGLASIAHIISSLLSWTS